MKIELKNISIYPRMSHETTAFNASVYVNGKRLGEASNDGQGGENTYSTRELFLVLAKYAKTLPAITFTMDIDHNKKEDMTIDQTPDTVISDLLEAYQLNKRLKSCLKRSVLFVKDNKLFKLKATSLPEQVNAVKHLVDNKKVPRSDILNLLEFNDAFNIYKSLVYG